MAGAGRAGSGSGNTVDSGNSTSTPLSGGATFTGVWRDVRDFSTITVVATADVSGTLWYDFSSDASTVARSVQLSPGDTSNWGIHALAPVAQYGRVRVVNGASAQASLSVQVLLSQAHRQIVSRAAQTINDYSDVVNVRLLTEPWLDEARGKQQDRSVIHKFGANPSVAAATEEDIWTAGGSYTGWLTAASAVRIKAGGSADDDSGGTGARTVVVVGLDENWADASEEITTAGASASSATTTTFLRVFRAYVSDVGAYTGVNAGTIDIETTGGVLVARIGLSAGASAGLGQTQLAMYTVPAGKQAFVRRFGATVQGTKAADVYFWQRQNADTVAAPFTSRRTWATLLGLEGHENIALAAYVGPFPAKTDIWASAVGPTNGAAVSADFDIVLVDA